jgi:hypothetical protein
VDTFVAPAVAQPADTNPAIELAKALESVRPSLSRWASEESYKEGKRWTAEEIAKGQKAYAENRQKFKEAVDQGMIPAGASPHFRRGYRQAELRNLGFTYDQRLREAYAQSAVVNSDDPEALSQFMAEFRQGFMQESIGDAYDDIDVAEALLPQIERSQSVLAQRLVEQRIRSVEEGYARAFEEEAFVTLDQFAAQDGEFDVPAAAGVLQTRLNDAIANGMNKTQANKTLVDSVVNKAIDAGDMSLLDVLDEIQAGPGGKLGNTGYARSKREVAENQITTDSIRQERYEIWQRDQERSERGRAMTSQALGKIIENPTADINAELEAIRKVDPSAASSLLSFQQAKLSADNRIIERPSIVAGLWEQLDDPAANHSAIIAEYAAARLITPGTAKAAHSYAKQTEERSAVIEDPAFRDATGDLKDLLTEVDEIGIPNPQSVERTRLATRELRNRFVSWAEQNPDAPYHERANWLDEQVTKMIRSPRWASSGGSDTFRTVDPRNPGADNDEPLPPRVWDSSAPQRPGQDFAPPTQQAIDMLLLGERTAQDFEREFGPGSALPHMGTPFQAPVPGGPQMSLAGPLPTPDEILSIQTPDQLIALQGRLDRAIKSHPNPEEFRKKALSRIEAANRRWKELTQQQ